MHPLAERTSLFTESVIREMTRVANECGAINLAQGFPDFECPKELKEAACRAINEDHNQYAITWGSPRLREAIAKKVSNFNKIPCDPAKNLVVTCGATEAMMASMLSLCDPGDEVVIFEPFYENYGPDAAISGARPKFVPLKPPEWRFDPERLKKAFSRKTKAIIINTPNNPLGKVFSRDELKLIADMCVDNDVIAVTDEIYEHIVYDGLEHVSIATLPGMHERTITICGFSKTYSVTGWRVAYTVAGAGLTGAIKRIHDFLTVGAPAPLQEACVAALALPEKYYADLVAMYDAKRRILVEGLKAAGFRAYMPRAAYYVMCDADHVMEKLGAKDDTELALRLAREIGVASVPGSSFYGKKALGARQLRFMFSKRDETLRQAASRIAKLA
jgi:aminotransferase